MTEGEPSFWSEFHAAAAGRPPRELLVRTLNFFDVERRAPGVAVDLGCGSGPDTVELLHRGWTVHAVDSDRQGLAMLAKAAEPEWQDRLHTHPIRLEDFDFPACDLIWASFALPFCRLDAWPQLLTRAIGALRVGGRFAGDMFGKEHAWSSAPDVLTRTEAQLRADLHPLQIEAFDIENGYRVSGDEVTRWHAFAFAARVVNAIR